MNVYHFADLPDDMKNDLIEYIHLRFRKTRSFDYRYTAYGMKQDFSRYYEWRKGRPQHVTTRCFMEAMGYCGYKVYCPMEYGREGWIFNATYRKHRGRHWIKWSPETAYMFFPGWKKKEEELLKHEMKS